MFERRRSRKQFLLNYASYGYNSSTLPLASVCTNLGGDHFDLKNLHWYENLVAPDLPRQLCSALR